MSEQSRKIILTGKSRTGKSTVIRRTCKRLVDERIDLWGFTTKEIKGSGRAGLHVLTMNGVRVPFAHVEMSRGPRMGPYRVDVPAFEEAVLPVLEPPMDIDGFPIVSVGIIDEVDKLTCLSEKFIKRVEELLKTPTYLLIVVSDRGGGLMKTLRDMAGDDLIEVMSPNRELLPDIITDTFLAYMGI